MKFINWFYLRRAIKYFKLSNYEKGIKFLDKITDKGDSFLYKNLFMIDIYEEKKEFINAISCCDEFIKKNSNESSEYLPVVYLHRGINYLCINQYDTACNDFLNAIKLSPQNYEVYSNISFALIAKGELEEALTYINKAIEINPDCSTAYINRSYIYIMSDRIVDAIKDCNKVKEIDPQEELAYINSTFIYLSINDFKKAIDECSSIININPKSAVAYLHRAIARFSKFEYSQDGFDDVNKAIELAPHVDLSYVIRGNYKYRRNLFEEANDDYNKAITLNPYSYMAHIGKIYVLVELDRIEDSLESCEQAKNALAMQNEVMESFTSSSMFECLDYRIPKKSEMIKLQLAYGFLYYKMNKLDESINSYYDAFENIIKQENMLIENKDNIILYKYKSCDDNTIKSLKNETVWLSNPKYFNDSYESEILTNSEDEVPAMTTFCKGFRAVSFGCSLDECGGDNYYMWDLYAQESKGICLVYEFSPALLTIPLCKYAKIVYRDQIWNVKYCTLSVFIDHVFFIKGTKWEYENEFRILYYDTQFKINERGINIPIEDLGLKLKKVIFGRKTSQENKYKIKKIFSDKHDDITYSQIIQQDNSFNLSIINIDN